MIYEFKAIILQHEKLNVAYIEPPFDVVEVFGSKRVKVKATFDGVPYRGSIVNMGGCYMLGLTQEIRKMIGKGFNDAVFVTLEKDDEVRQVDIPEELATAMEGNEKALTTFQSLPYTAQKEYVTWISSAKRQETKTDRILKATALLSEGKRLNQ